MIFALMLSLQILYPLSVVKREGKPPKDACCLCVYVYDILVLVYFMYRKILNIGHISIMDTVQFYAAKYGIFATLVT